MVSDGEMWCQMRRVMVDRPHGLVHLSEAIPISGQISCVRPAMPTKPVRWVSDMGQMVVGKQISCVKPAMPTKPGKGTTLGRH